MNERDKLDERYLEAQLREELGPETDLSDRVLRQVYAQPARRLVPPPRRNPRWQPLAAAASVLLVAGLATFALVKLLPETLRQHQPERPRAVKQVNEEATTPDTTPEPEDTTPPADPGGQPDAVPHERPDEQVESPASPPSDSQPEKQPAKEPEPEPGDDVVDEAPKPPEKEDGTAGDDVESPPTKRPHTDPHPMPPDYSKPEKRTVLVSAWNGEGIKVTNERGTTRLEPGDAHQFRAGDRVWVKGFADFTLMDGGLLRVDGEFTFEGEPESMGVTLHDGALYADTLAPLTVSGDGVSAVVSGVGVVEERLRAFDLYCLQGRIDAGDEHVPPGHRSRLEQDGLGRAKAITWSDVQGEFRFLKDAPVRVALREDLNDVPGTLFGGVLKDGVLRGESDSDTGLGFYLRETYAFGQGDVVRFRFRVEKPCEMILQFGTVEDGNWRHKMGGVKAGEWIEYELPLADLYKTTDVAQKAAPGLALKFFQLHPEDAKADMRIDWIEIVHRAG